jgi:hypothetical protein
MELNLDRVRQNVHNATTEDLLDRATVYRPEMEKLALDIIDAELLARGITIDDVQTHLDARQDILTREDGSVVQCTFCHRPAIQKGWGWWRIYGLIPIWPRVITWCDVHLPVIAEVQSKQR